MTYIRLTFSSEMLHGNTDVSVFYPDPLACRVLPAPGQATGNSKYDKRKRYQVLWLMHGGGGTYRLAAGRHDPAQVQCGTDRRGDADHPRLCQHDERRRLPAICGGGIARVYRFLFPISRKEDNFIAGLSYGGCSRIASP